VIVLRYLCLAALSWVVLPGFTRGETPEAGAPPAELIAPTPPADAGTAEASAGAASPADEGAAIAPSAEPGDAGAAAPSGTSAVGASPAPSAAPAEAMTADEKANLKVRSLEERVSDLKEKIFRTKARLMNLQEMVIGGDITSGSKAVLVHRNEMGSSFYLESVAYALDGAPIYTKSDQDGDLEKREEIEIFNGRMVPGHHQISVQLVYRGHGFGVFSYLEGYRFRVQSSHTFNAEPGKVSTIKVVGYEKGGMTAELKDRPAVRYDVEVQREEVRRAGPAAAPAAAPAVPAAVEGAAR
jgi:hypothetical protein